MWQMLQDERHDWFWSSSGYDPELEGQRETLGTLGNGRFATRAALPWATVDGIHYPGTYLAGGYNRLTSEIDGLLVEEEDLVNLPNWLHLTYRVDGGDWLDLARVDVLDYHLDLDLRQGLLTRRLRIRDAEGRHTSIWERRIVHISDPYLAALDLTIVAEDWSGRIELRSGIDGRVTNSGVENYGSFDGRHLEPVDTGSLGIDGVWLKTRMRQSRIEIDMAARTHISVDGVPVDGGRALIEEAGYIAQDAAIDVVPGSRIVADKVVALYTSRDRAISESGGAAREAVLRAGRAGGFDDLLRTHTSAWERLWRGCDIVIGLENDDEAERILRLHLFHLLSTASPNVVDLDVGLPARGLTGEAYRGHIFWDELFAFPYLNLHLPGVARSLLLYRYRRLRRARWSAEDAGYAGAMFPWQSGSSGREETSSLYGNPRTGGWIPDHTRLQRHIGSAIVYNVWSYYQTTGDRDFLLEYGAEMILEIARFWSSIATWNAEIGRYEIHGVMGPDEFHTAYPWADTPGLSNNTYTNVMAVWVLCRALDVLDLLPDERRDALWDALDLSDAETRRWDEISRTMRIVTHGDGILSQFEGYGDLAELDWDAYREKYGDIQRLDFILDAEGDSPNRYKASKQPDVQMLFYLFSAEELAELFARLGYPCDRELIPRNVRYYSERSSRGSTLSRVVQAWVLAREDRPRSWHWFQEALRSDVSDIQGGSTAEGIHIGAMAGTIDLIERGYTGLEARLDALWLNPRLPDQLNRLSMRVHYRGCPLEITITHDELRVTSSPDAASAIPLCIRGERTMLAPGDTAAFHLDGTMDVAAG